MARREPPSNSTFSRIEAPILVALQGILAVLGLGSMILVPRSGEPATLIPLGIEGARSIPDILSRPGILMLARGSIRNSYVVSGEAPSFFENLGDGVLTVSATFPGCGSSEPGQ